MALAYPEGECFFRRSVLNGGNSENYKADDPKDFFSHMLVEYVWNVESDHGSKQCNSPSGYGHPRSGYRIVRGSWWDTDYGCWTQLNFNYGPKPNDIKRRIQHTLCTDGNRFRDHEKGGAAEAFFMIIPMPTREERWVWIDRMAHIRAIYFPIAYAVDKDHDDLCGYVQLNFALPRKLRVAAGDKGWLSDVWTDKVLGMKSDAFRSVGFDVSGLVQLLTLPRQLRRDNCYNLRLIKMTSAGAIKTISVTKSYNDGPDKSWLTVANGNFGLDLTWKPAEKSTWMESFIRNTLTIAVGFIPTVGPIVQILFSVGWELISQENPQGAYDLIKTLCPGIDLTDKIISDMVQGAKETQQLMPDGWDKMGLDFKSLEARSDSLAPRPIEDDMDRTLTMMLQGAILAASGTPNDRPKADEPPGEIIKDNAENATQGVVSVATDAGKTLGSVA